MGPNGSGAAGGAPGFGGSAFGPGALLHYQGGGVGDPSQPITADWNTGIVPLAVES
ncbi:MAG: hypothetical protein AAF725_26605 [Acidobacteriota bacterium]